MFEDKAHDILLLQALKERPAQHVKDLEAQPDGAGVFLTSFDRWCGHRGPGCGPQAPALRSLCSEPVSAVQSTPH